MGAALTPALLGKEDVALHPKRAQLFVKRAHLAADLFDPLLELRVGQTGQLVWHGLGSYSTGGRARGLRVRMNTAAMTNRTVTAASAITLGV